MIKPKDILYVNEHLPLVGSNLKSSEREAMVGALVCACQRKGSWGKVSESEMGFELGGMITFLRERKNCIAALNDLIIERLVLEEYDEQGVYFEVTPALLRLLIESTYAGGHIYPNKDKLLQDLQNFI